MEAISNAHDMKPEGKWPTGSLEYVPKSATAWVRHWRGPTTSRFHSCRVALRQEGRSVGWRTLTSSPHTRRNPHPGEWLLQLGSL